MDRITREMRETVERMDRELGRNTDTERDRRKRNRDEINQHIVEFRKRAREKGLSAKEVAMKEVELRKSLRNHHHHPPPSKSPTTEPEEPLPSLSPAESPSVVHSLSTLLNGEAQDFDEDDYSFLSPT